MRPRMSLDEKIRELHARVEQGGAPKYHEKNLEHGKLFARRRVELLLDEGSFIEDAALAPPPALAREQDVDVLELEGVRAHSFAPWPGRLMRSRMIASRTIAMPASKPMSICTLLSARTTGTPRPPAPTRAAITTMESESMMHCVTPARIVGRALGSFLGGQPVGEDLDLLAGGVHRLDGGPEQIAGISGNDLRHAGDPPGASGNVGNGPTS